MSADLEDRLRRYGRVLDRAAVEPTGLHAPATAPRRLSGVRLLAAGTAAAVAAAALVVAGFVAGDDAGYKVRVAGEGNQGAGLDRNPGDPFPRLLIEGWRVTRADESSGPMENSPHPDTWLQVYRHPERGYDGAQVSVQTLPAGAWSVGDGSRPVETSSGEARFYRSNDLQATVVWAPDDERSVVVRGIRIDDDEMEAVTRGLQARPDGRGWDATVLPAGLTVTQDAATIGNERYHTADVMFARDGDELELTLVEDGADAFENLVDDRVNSAAELHQATVLGYPAAVTRYENSQRHSAMWYAGGVVYELDGDAGRTEAFFEALEDLRVVDDGTWESAQPDSSVTPGQRAGEVDRMLADIPQPPGFDSATLKEGKAVSDRYQLGARVSGAVACAWIDRWAEARRAGDQATVNEAVDAMATSRSWQVLTEMNEEGDYSEVLWSYADAMANGGKRDGRDFDVEETASNALGCPRNG